VASLAVVRGDLSKAVRIFQMALEANPEDLDAAFQLGYAWISVGDLDQAGTVFAALIQQAKAAQDPRLEGWGLNGRGDVLVAQGDGPEALAAYKAGLAIAAGLAKRDPVNTGWQRALFVSKAKIGDVLVAQGDGPGALAAYQAGLAIAEGLAKRDPVNTGWQVDIAVLCSKLGSLDSLLSIQERQEYLSRGLNLLTTLKQAARLHANQDWTGWFDSALRSLKGTSKNKSFPVLLRI
jgi:tetratricopeptide (TPR) repeat protein